MPSARAPTPRTMFDCALVRSISSWSTIAAGLTGRARRVLAAARPDRRGGRSGGRSRRGWASEVRAAYHGASEASRAVRRSSSSMMAAYERRGARRSSLLAGQPRLRPSRWPRARCASWAWPSRGPPATPPSTPGAGAWPPPTRAATATTSAPSANGRGVKRLLSLGDSFAWGAGIEFDDTYAQRLERRCLAGVAARPGRWCSSPCPA